MNAAWWWIREMQNSSKFQLSHLKDVVNDQQLCKIYDYIYFKVLIACLPKIDYFDISDLWSLIIIYYLASQISKWALHWIAAMTQLQLMCTKAACQSSLGRFQAFTQTPDTIWPKPIWNGILELTPVNFGSHSFILKRSPECQSHNAMFSQSWLHLVWSSCVKYMNEIERFTKNILLDKVDWKFIIEEK